jgi:hypothetical protein
MANNLGTDLVLDALNARLSTLAGHRPAWSTTQTEVASAPLLSLVAASKKPDSCPDRIGSRCRRQLHGRELRLDLEAGVDPPSFMAEQTDVPDDFSAEYIEDLLPTPEETTTTHTGLRC